MRNLKEEHVLSAKAEGAQHKTPYYLRCLIKRFSVAVLVVVVLNFWHKQSRNKLSGDKRWGSVWEFSLGTNDLRGAKD